MRGSRSATVEGDCRTVAPPTGARRLLRRSLPFLLAAVLAFLAREPLAALNWREVASAVERLPISAWGLAISATIISYLALGRYDEVVHGTLGTGVPARQARLSGMAAIAIGQMAGAGLLTGTLTRWRLVPGLTLAAAGRVTLCVTLSFLASWAVLTSGSVLLFLPGVPFLHLAAQTVLALFGLLVVLALALPRLALPPLALGVRILALGAADSLAAGLALYLLFPVAPDFTQFLPAFLLALGAGLCLGTPGGIGPFELVLVAFLPGQPPEDVAAAILCYRLVYFAAPALIAGGATLLAGTGTDEAALCARRSDPPLAAGPAECLLHRQGLHRLFHLPDAAHTGWLTARAGQALVALFDPAGPPCPALLRGFARDAGERGLTPGLYKIGPRTAALARRSGWRLCPVAEDFWLAPAAFTPAGPARAGLRRKLRHAERAGLRVEGLAPGKGTPPWHLMAKINRDWSAHHGGERGFSMGRFAVPYLAGQRLFLAWSGMQLVGFVSFHPGEREWALDLVRQSADAPDGTMHALVTFALRDAAACGIARLSLAAAPLPAPWLSARITRIATRLFPAASGTGLRRFKESFAPNRTRLYLAARSRTALLWTGIEIIRAIHWPAPLVGSGDAPATVAGERGENLRLMFPDPRGTCGASPAPPGAGCLAFAHRTERHDQRPFPPA